MTPLITAVALSTAARLAVCLVLTPPSNARTPRTLGVAVSIADMATFSSRILAMVSHPTGLNTHTHTHTHYEAQMS